MRSVPVLVAVALGAVVLASGCGQQHAGTPASPPLSASASARRRHPRCPATQGRPPSVAAPHRRSL